MASPYLKPDQSINRSDSERDPQIFSDRDPNPDRANFKMIADHDHNN